MPQLNLLVIRSKDPEALKQQYEQLGFQFTYHQHGNGPFHFSHEEKNFVFEIYPLNQRQEKADNYLRLGFDFVNLEKTVERLRQTNWQIVSEVKESQWGKIAVIQDMEGRKIELKES